MPLVITIQNNSGNTYTDAQVEIEEKDSNDRITPINTNDLLSQSEIQSGDSVTLTAEIRFVATRNIAIGDYVNYKISFLCDGVRKYFNYRIEISG